MMDMKVVILAGGLGTRISEESHLRPKPMIEIGGSPILWHIMKIYSQYGLNEFIICLGYKGHIIKEYFTNYYLYNSNITFDFSDNNKMLVHNNVAEPWKVTLVNTGLNTQTGGRIQRIHEYLDDEAFMLTYGDGVSDVNIGDLLQCHQEHKPIITMTAVQPGGRFGVLEIDNEDRVRCFAEKAKEDGGWINGGFMVVEPEVFSYLENDSTIFEKEPLERIAQYGKLQAFKHHGFWQCMDTQRDKYLLETMWNEEKAPWKIWR